MPPQRSVDWLLRYIELERIDRDVFRGHNPAERTNNRVFGGHVAAQALRAASATVEAEHHPHSLHGYFLRPGEPGTPIAYLVDRIRDGRSFTTRRVRGMQHGEAIFSMSCSFHRREDGAEYQLPPASDVPDPDAGEGFLEESHSRFAARSPFEVLEAPTPPPNDSGVHISTRRSWVRTRGKLPDDPGMHASVLAYLSDMGLVSSARLAVGADRDDVIGASLDHAVWFHRPVRADEWLLVDIRPISSSGARALVVGTVHTRDGVLGASVAQECLIRPRR